MSPITCIIPFFNEAGRIETTLKKLQAIKLIQQFILVNDGSTDHPLIKQRSSLDITLLHHIQNQGKTSAIQTAIPHIKYPKTLFFDADITHFNPDQVINNLRIALKTNHNMIIFRQIQDPWYCKLIGMDLLFSGERLVTTHTLKQIKFDRNQEYSFEQTLNTYHFQNNLSVGWVSFNSVNMLKLKKYPLQIALKKSLALQHILLSPHNFKNSYLSFKQFQPNQLKM